VPLGTKRDQDPPEALESELFDVRDILRLQISSELAPFMSGQNP